MSFGLRTPPPPPLSGPPLLGFHEVNWWRAGFRGVLVAGGLCVSWWAVEKSGLLLAPEEFKQKWLSGTQPVKMAEIVEQKQESVELQGQASAALRKQL